MVSFRVSEMNAAVVRQPYKRYADHYIEIFSEYGAEGCYKVLQGTSLSGEFHPSDNGFVHGVIHAYNGHHNLVIRPDDVWLAIMVQFGLFVNGNAEALRSVFVDHEGKKTLKVFQSATLETADYGRLANDMTSELRKNVKGGVCDWVLPTFSTTTKNDVVVSSVVLMATFKEYFRYWGEFCCGIPEVTLEGTTEDWEDINRRVDELYKYGGNCTVWANMLKPVTEQLVESSKGNVNVDFWRKICHYIANGSGPRYVSGWISVFCVYDNDGKWQGGANKNAYPHIDTNWIPAGYLTVDVTVDDNGVEHETLMFAGHMGYGVVEDRKGIVPKVAWAISLKDKAKVQSSASCF